MADYSQHFHLRSPAPPSPAAAGAADAVAAVAAASSSSSSAAQPAAGRGKGGVRFEKEYHRRVDHSDDHPDDHSEDAASDDENTASDDDSSDSSSSDSTASDDDGDDDEEPEQRPTTSIKRLAAAAAPAAPRRYHRVVNVDLPRGTIRRLLRRAGFRRTSASVYPVAQKLFEVINSELAKFAVIMKSGAGTSTLSSEDIVAAAERAFGMKVYSAGEAQKKKKIKN